MLLWEDFYSMLFVNFVAFLFLESFETYLDNFDTDISRVVYMIVEELSDLIGKMFFCNSLFFYYDMSNLQWFREDLIFINCLVTERLYITESPNIC